MAPVVSGRETADRRLWAVFAAAVILLYARTAFLSGDHVGEMAGNLDRAYRVALGQVIYRDFDCVSTPLTFFIQGATYRLFGARWVVTRVYMALQGAAGVALTYRFAVRTLALSPGKGLAAAALALLWSPQWIWSMAGYNCDAGFFSLLAVLALYGFWERPGGFGVALFGLSCALTFWCKQDMGAAALVLGAGILFLLPRSGKTVSRRRLLAWFGLGAALPLLLFLAYATSQQCLQASWHWIIVRAKDYGTAYEGGGFAHKMYLTVFSPRSQFGKLMLVVYAAAAALPLWVASRLDARKRGPLVRDACASVFLGGIFYTGFLTHDAGQFDALQTGLGCVLAVLWSALEQGAAVAADPKRFARRGRVAVVLVAAVLAVRSYKYSWGAIGTALAGEGMPTLENTAYGDLHLPAAKAEATASIIRFIRGRVRPDEPVFIFPPDQDILNVHFALGLVPPHPLSVSYEMRGEDIPWILGALERNKVEWVILNGRPPVKDQGWSRAIYDYVDHRFAPVERLSPALVVFRRSARDR